MKKILIITFAALVLAVSCNKEGRDENSSVKMVEWSFEAPATKASFSNSGKFSWEAGDKIAVWDATSESFISFTTPAGSGVFYATAPETANFQLSAFYPEGIALTPEKVDISAAVTPMCATVDKENNKLNFKHIGALVTVNLLNVPETAKTIVLYSDDTALSGEVTLSEGQWLKGGTAANRTVTLGAGENLVLRFPVPVGTYTLGFKVENGLGELLAKRETSTDFSFQRAHSYAFPTLNFKFGDLLSDYTVGLEELTAVSDGENWNF